MNRKDRRKHARTNSGWEPWGRGRPIRPTADQIEKIIEQTSQSREEVLALIEDTMQGEVIYLNNIYQVSIRRNQSPAPSWPEIIHLSIKRRDRAPVGVEHFRDFQRIKNELVGPEYEAVELYPAETRLVDSANQYHLWVLADEKFRIPFGFNERLVQDAHEVAGSGAQQRPFHTE